jgi:hypothetical protein
MARATTGRLPPSSRILRTPAEWKVPILPDLERVPSGKITGQDVAPIAEPREAGERRHGLMGVSLPVFRAWPWTRSTRRPAERSVRLRLATNRTLRQEPKKIHDHGDIQKALMVRHH